LSQTASEALVAVGDAPLLILPAECCPKHNSNQDDDDDNDNGEIMVFVVLWHSGLGCWPIQRVGQCQANHTSTYMTAIIDDDDN